MKTLVVDDSPSIRRILRKELEEHGHTVYDAGSGQAALDLLETVLPDVISLDVDMPGISGYEICSRIRNGKEKCSAIHSSLAKVPIIFLTACDTEEARRQCYQAGASGLVIKPFMRGELTSEVERAVKSKELQDYTALVVDDSRTIRRLLRQRLEEKGLTVIEAVNGLEGLEAMKKDPSGIDLVITDYIMPKMNGDELCQSIRNELGLKKTPIIFLSSYRNKDFMIRMFESGASDFLIKPFVKEELEARVAVHLKAKNLGDRLLRKVVELKREHKLKDEFLSICSHDLRSPLNGVVGFTQIMLAEEDTTDEQREYLTHIQNSSDFLLSIINDILDLGRLQSEGAEPELKPASIREILDSCLETLRHMATPKGIELVIDNQIRTENTIQILADENGIKRLFNNLISNSIKFSHPGDKITIRLEQGDNNTITTSVIDQGIGIPADKLPHVFDSDAQTSQQGTQGEQSFGLGMSIVKQIVEQHEGKISIESEQGKGTNVKVVLPISAQQAVSPN